MKDCPGAVWEHNYYCKHSEDVGLECLLTEDNEESIINSDDDDDDTDSSQCGDVKIPFKPRKPIAKVCT